MSENTVIQEIKCMLSIEDALHQYLGIKPDRKSNAKSLNIKCPFHNDRSPSFTIWPQSNTWKCWAGCGHGDVINLVSKIHSFSNEDAILLLRKQLLIERKWPATVYTTWINNRKLLTGFKETKKQIVFMLLEIRSLFKIVLKQVTSFEDIDLLGDVYHTIPLIEKYLEELESREIEMQIATVKHLLPFLNKWRENCE
ncbi:hypothetical protein G3A_07200 [Bacillus sp. 17376]|uniref:Zinc finger CHC2-type domain-containing protein n=1 Tax=Mesobacillus boroniphilus JCM 21738 TaxID=1294265 RepID=W4RUQ9_9BACI|nr:CHC2 zinc finger domain-containing protein [Mesobacillus boroniphilus]ESU33244.1 hypothetical protein G3A_07200 [Bacillus sp. 17376]GAE48160.1 hypothetical protein JCM21738_5244 [Mesobacillus boroniphilus JCM 21738]